MPDIFSKRKRSAVMAAVRSRGNRSTELRLIALMRTHGITGWRRGSKLTGRPDFIFPRSTGSGLRRAKPLAVFVDGCFWHGCPKHGTSPKTNASFWLAKITGNKARDRRVNRLLRAKGWKVLRVWEHELPPTLGASARQGAREKERRLLRRLSTHLDLGRGA